MKRNLLTLLLVFLPSLISSTSADPVTCISCVWSNSDGNPDYHSCYTNPVNNTAVQCKDSTFYCQTFVKLYNGGATVIQRSCINPLDDVDVVSNEVPTNNRCIVSSEPARRGLEIKCYYPCKTDRCNNITLADIQRCNGDCSSGLGQGYCDFTTGRCACNEGWLGPNCDFMVPPTTASRSCVQCNGIADPTCEKSTRATLCPATTFTYNFCSTLQTTVFDRDQNVISSYVSRGCSRRYSSADECEFYPHTSDPLHQDAIELTCTSSCDYDGCNTGLPDGRVSGEERKDLFCYECESDSDTSDCALGKLSRTRCPSSARFCKSVVTYFVSERKDLSYKASPEYRFEKIVRKCGGHSLVSSCRSRKLGVFDAKRVKCEETCQTDGCNDGWPSRPKCSQCNSTYTNDGYDQCWSDPQWPTQCPKPYHSFCVATDYQLKSGSNQNGFRQRIERGCSFHDIGEECVTSVYGNIEVESCNQTCSTDGCNLGFHRLRNGSGKSTYASSIALTFVMWLIAQAVADIS